MAQVCYQAAAVVENVVLVVVAVVDSLAVLNPTLDVVTTNMSVRCNWDTSRLQFWLQNDIGSETSEM